MAVHPLYLVFTLIFHLSRVITKVASYAVSPPFRGFPRSMTTHCMSRRAFLSVTATSVLGLATRRVLADAIPTPIGTPAVTPASGPDLTKYPVLFQRPGTVDTSSAVQLVVVGDNSMARGTAASIAGHGGDYNYPLSGVSDWLHAADLAVGNQEGVISLPGVGVERPQGYRLRADPKAAPALAQAGFGLMNLANNHTRDFGPDGIKATMDALHAANLQTIGAGADYDSARAPAITALRGLKVGWMAYVNVPDPPEYGIAWEASGYGRSRYEAIKLVEQVKAVRPLVDVLIVQYHWGIEYQPEPFETQVFMGHQAIDAGADIVIGHHPHVIQPVETYQKKLIIYSLGNFMFDQDGRSGMAVWLRLDSHGIIDVHALPVNPGVHPTWANGAHVSHDKKGAVIIAAP